MTPYYQQQLDRIERLLQRIIVQQARILTLIAKEGEATMALQEDINTLVQEVQENTTVTDSVQALLSNLTDMLTNLKNQTNDPAAQKALQDAIAQLDANNKRIADAVTKNTPAAE